MQFLICVLMLKVTTESTSRYNRAKNGLNEISVQIINSHALVCVALQSR